MVPIAKLKILYLLTKDDVGGAQKYVADLAAHLDQNRFEPKILCGGRDVRWLSNRVLPWMFFVNDWLAIIELVRVFRRERPDIIHLNSSKAGVLGSFATGLYKLINQTTNKPKTIFTAHGWVFNPTNYVAAPIRWCYVMIHWFAAHFQDTIINVSAYDRELALHYKIAAAHKLVTIHNGIDPNIKFLSRTEARAEIIRRLQTLCPKPYTLNPACPWVGSIGRITKEKDYGTLLEAARLVPDAYFFVIGAGPEEENLRLTTDDLQLTNRLFFIPPAGDDARFLSAFDVFVLPSIKEGLPYVLLEAMASRVPTVVSDAGGMPEVVEHEISGLVVRKRDPRSLGNTIAAFLADKEKAIRYASAARSRVLTNFTLEQMVATTARVYEEHLRNSQ